MKIYVAKTFKQKLMGLMGKTNIDYGLFFPKVNSIHTFFMRESIDVIGLDKDMVIREIYPNVKPNKTLFLRDSIHTLELPNGASKDYNIGDKVKI